MITKQTTKRAAKILAEQKREYERKFQGAKGDSKAIARVAAEYRSEYGKTPLKRWHNALSQAAKETSSHAAPVRKPAKPATPSLSSAELVKKIEASKEYLMNGGDVLCWIVWQRAGWYVMIGHPGQREALSHGPYKDRETAVKDAEAYRARVTGFTFVHENAWAKNWRKARLDWLESKRKLDAQVQKVEKRKAAQKASREAAKAKKPKATWRVGTWLQSPKDGSIYRISYAEVVAGATPYVRYTLTEPHGKYRQITLDDKPEAIKSWRFVSSKEATKYWKRYLDERRRKEQFDMRAKEAEEAKKRKEQFKALIKKNPDWIKNFAKQTGLSTAVIESMYRICTTDDLRPVMCGIYCSEQGEIVATDAHSLAAVAVKSMPAAWKGKIFAPSGKTIEGKYPNYEGVLVNKGKVKVWVGHAQVERSYKEIPNKPSAEFENSRGDMCVDLGSVRLMSQKYKRMMKVFEAMRETPQCLQTGEETTATGFVSRYVRAVMMPVLKNDY